MLLKEYESNTFLLKLQRLKNKVLRTAAHFPRRTPVRELLSHSLVLYFDFMHAASRKHTES
jgi:hypothetical protein